MKYSFIQTLHCYIAADEMVEFLIILAVVAFSDHLAEFLVDPININRSQILFCDALRGKEANDPDIPNLDPNFLLTTRYVFPP